MTLDELIGEQVEEGFYWQELIEGREIDEEERARMRPSLRESMVRRVSDYEAEQRFLDRIGVSVEALVYGLMPARYDRWIASETAGWTFRIEDMARFGIHNVAYAGDGDYPSPFTDSRLPLIVFKVPPR